MLVCRQCLGVKYGNHPDRSRNWWRENVRAPRERLRQEGREAE
jgi:hypothetical protein